MHYEYEHQYRAYNKNDIHTRLIAMYGKHGVKKDVRLLKNTVYSKSDDPSLYMRVREDGEKTYFTLKYYRNEFPLEYEVTVENASTFHTMLSVLGYKVKYVVEKIRETWTIPTAEIAFDQYPGLPEFMEIEASTKKNLLKLERELQLKPAHVGSAQMYKEYYGISTSHKKMGDIITFRTASKHLSALIKQNLDEFKRIFKEQRKLAKQLLS